MNSKNLLFIPSLLLLLLLACQKDNSLEINCGENGIWHPFTEVTRGDKTIMVGINMAPNGVAIDYCQLPLEPDYFEVFFSINPDSLKLYKQIEDIEDNFFTIDNLDHETPYYIRTRSIKEGEDSVISNLVMTVLGNTPELEVVYPELNYKIEYFDHSFDYQHLMFQSRVLENDEYIDRFFIIDTDNLSQKIRVPQFNYGIPRWSPIGNQILFSTKIDSSDSDFPKIAVAILDIETQNTDTLFTVDTEIFSISELMFTPNADSIIFLSSEGNPRRYNFDFWSFDLISKTKTKLSDFISIGFEVKNCCEKPVKLDLNNNLIYLSGTFDKYRNTERNLFFDENIFVFDFKTKEFLPLLDTSNWSDWQPTPSPNGKNMAFLSRRSGREELWLYSFSTNKFKQIIEVSPHANFEWKNDNEVFLTVYRDNNYQIMSLNIN